MVAARVSRPGFLGGSLAAAALALGGVGSLLEAVPAPARGRRPLLGFTGIPVSSADAVVVPDGYTARVLIAWGDPIAEGPEFSKARSTRGGSPARLRSGSGAPLRVTSGCGRARTPPAGWPSGR